MTTQNTNAEDEVYKLREQLERLAGKLESKKEATEDKYQTLKREIETLKDKYTFLLESMLKLKMQEQWKSPISLSNIPDKQAETNSSIGDFQILFLLKESKATSKEFAVTASQLKQAFDLKRTVRTIRDKLNYLESRGLVISFSKKPILYSVSPSGLAILDKQGRTIISSNETIT